MLQFMWKLASNGPLSGGHRAINITNGHFIHAGFERGSEFLSIYLKISMYDFNYLELHLVQKDKLFFFNSFETRAL